MTTNEWDRVCATVFTWRHGHRMVRLNMPAISDVCGGAWQVYWTGGTTKEAGHTRADLLVYCEREGITLPELPEEWCPEPAWGLWVLDEYGNDSRVAVRADDSECIALCSDGSWGHTRGTDPWCATAVINDCGFEYTTNGLPAARAYRAYAAEHGLPMPPADWWPEPVEEPAKPYSLADDPRLREVVRTKWGEARWYEGNSNDGMHLAVDHEEGFCLASVYPDGRWIAYSGPTSADEIQRASKATNPANAYTECMAVLRDLGSLVDEKPDPDGWIPWGGGECPVPAGTVVEYRLHDGGVDTDKAGELDWDHCDCADIIAYRIISDPEPAEKPDANACAVQPPTLRDRLLNLSTRMWLDGSPYANELRDLARELDGGAK